MKKWMSCYRGLTKGLQEPKLRSKTKKLERADLMLVRAGLRLERSDDGFEA